MNLSRQCESASTGGWPSCVRHSSLSTTGAIPTRCHETSRSLIRCQGVRFGRVGGPGSPRDYSSPECGHGRFRLSVRSRAGPRRRLGDAADVLVDDREQKGERVGLAVVRDAGPGALLLTPGSAPTRKSPAPVTRGTFLPARSTGHVAQSTVQRLQSPRRTSPFRPPKRADRDSSALFSVHEVAAPRRRRERLVEPQVES
jgi:hypothetical protein